MDTRIRIARPLTQEEFKKIPFKPVYQHKSEFAKGGAAFVDEMQALGGGAVGLAGQAVGSKAIRDWGLDTYQRNMEEAVAGAQAPKVARVEDIGGVGDALDWASYQGTKGLASVAALALSGGVGGAIAKGVTKRAVKDMAKAQVGKRLMGKVLTEGAKKGAQKQVRKNITRGAVTGGFTGAFGMEGGGAFGSQVTDGVAPEDALGPSLAVGGINAALELVAPFRVAKKLGILGQAKSGVAKVIVRDKVLAKKAQNLAWRMTKGAAGTGTTEGITEGLQELVQIAGERWAKDEELLAELTPEQRSQVKNSLAAGALTGGLFGGGSRVFAPSDYAKAPTRAEVVGGLSEEAQARVTEATPISAPKDGESVPDYLARVEQEVKGETAEEAEAQAETAEGKGPEPGAGAIPEVGEGEASGREGEGAKPGSGNLGGAQPLGEPLTPDEGGRDEEQVEAEGGEKASEVPPELGRPTKDTRPALETLGALGSKKGKPFTTREQAVAAIARWQKDGTLQDEVGAKQDAVTRQVGEGGWVVDRLESQKHGERLVPRTKEDVEVALVDEMGEAWYERATELGILEIDDGEKPFGHAMAQFDEATGKIHIYTEALGAGPIAGVALHESSHATMSLLLNGLGKTAKEVRSRGVRSKDDASPARQATSSARAAQIRWLTKQLGIENQLGTLNGEAFTKELVRVEKLVEAGLSQLPGKPQADVREEAARILDEETLAYYTQYGYKSGKEDGLLRRTLDKMKANWLASEPGQMFGKVGIAPKVSDGVMVELARKASRYAVELRGEMERVGAPDAGGGSVLESKAQTKTQEFQNWFGDSKVVDDKEEPLRVYHGTNRDFAEFSSQAESRHIPLDTFFFTEDSDNAAWYAEDHKKEIRDEEGYITGFEDATVIPAYLSLRNPYRIEAQPNEPVSSIEAKIKYAKEQGHDGIILTGWRDDASDKPQYGVFSPNQIKSAIGNKGTFDPKSDNILESNVWHAGPSEWLPEPGFPYGRPRLDKVGTGEGGQLFGWGFYSAEEEKVSGPESIYAKGFSTSEKPASVVKLDIPDEDIKRMVQWDKLVGEQTEEVQAVMRLPSGAKPGEFMAGEGLYNTISELLPSVPGEHPKKKVSEYLSSLGIVGNKYLDSGSRAKGEGTYNYVVWDQDVLDRVAQLNPETGMRKFTQYKAAELNEIGKTLDAPASALERVSGALEKSRLYSRPEAASAAYLTSPLSIEQDEVHHPGVLNKLQHYYVEKLNDLWQMSAPAARAFNLATSRKASQQKNFEKEFVQPWIGLMGDFSKKMAQKGEDFSVQDMNDSWAAWHIVEDNVNLLLARKNANEAGVMLEKGLNYFEGSLEKDDSLRKEVKQIRTAFTRGRKNFLAGKNWDGTRPKAADNTTTRELTADEVKSKMMEKLEEAFDSKVGGTQIWKLTGIEDLRMNWEMLKHHGSGLATPEITSTDPEVQQALQDRLSLLGERMPKNAHDLYARVEGEPVFQGAGRQAKEIAKKGRDVLVDGGLITREEADAMEREYGHWVPLRRQEYDFAQAVSQQFGKGEVGGRPKIRAGTPDPDPPVHAMQNLMASFDANVTAAESNIAREYFAQQIQQDPTHWGDWFTVEQDPDAQRSYGKYGFVQTRKMGGKASDIPFYRDGERWLIKTNEKNNRALMLSNAVQNLESQELGPVFKLMSKANNWIRWVNISASPAFLLMNTPKDYFTAQLNLKGTKLADFTKEVRQEVVPSAKALMGHFAGNVKDSDILAWEKAGGRISFVESLRPNDENWGSLEAKIRHRQGKFNFGPGLEKNLGPGIGEAVGAARRGLEAIETMNIIAENVMRYSTWKVAKAQGLSDQEAALLSKDVTTNFDRKGLRAQTVGTYWLFYNATVQGNAQVLRNVFKGANKEKLWGALAATMAFAALNDQLGALMSDDEDGDGRSDWDSVPEWKKEKFGRIAGSNLLWPGDESTFATIPLPWVFNTVWRFGEMISEAARGVKDVAEIPADLAGLMLNTFNPIGGSDTTLAQMASPTAADPLVQIWENTSAFGRPLGPTQFPGEELKPDSEMAWLSTPKGYKWLAREMNGLIGGSVAEEGLIDWRPSTYKVLVDTFLGGGGKFFTQLAGSLGTAVTGEAPKIKEVPGLKTFLYAPGDPIEAQLYHERTAKVDQAKQVEKAFREGPTRDLMELQRVRREYAGELRMVGMMQDVERQIKDLRRQLRGAQMKGLDSRVTHLQNKIEQAQERFNKTWVRRVGN